jgi:hypothetical protein
MRLLFCHLSTNEVKLLQIDLAMAKHARSTVGEKVNQLIQSPFRNTAMINFKHLVPGTTDERTSLLKINVCEANVGVVFCFGAMWFRTSMPAFRRNMLSSSSGLK